MKKAIVIGIGNPNLKDDGIGFKVVENLDFPIDKLCFLNTDLKILQKILGYEFAIIIDGIKTGAPPGTIIEVDPLNTWQDVYASGTHSMSLFEVIRIGYTVFPEEMPKEIKVIGIEVEDISEFSNELSPSVKNAIPEVLKRIKKYLEEFSNKKTD